jgi:hypothetical protein
MADSPPPETLAWLHQSATVKGSTYSQVLLHLLERVEALEQKYETQRWAILKWGKDVEQPHQDKLDRLIALDSDDGAPATPSAPEAGEPLVPRLGDDRLDAGLGATGAH